jgi:deoxyribonuclease V
MILAVDVQYVGEQGFVSAVSFSHWGAVEPEGIYEAILNRIEEYEPGNFYKRELPCILQLLDENALSPDIIIVDGYVTLNEQEKAGLGMHLYKALGGKSKVIGVAKRSFSGISNQSKIFRGNSNNPLFVTSAGIEIEEAKSNIIEMYGNYRLPVLLKLVDKLCREKANICPEPV